MTTYRLPPGASKVELEGGTTYRTRGNPRRGATVEIDDPAHVRAMNRAGAVAGNVHAIGFASPPATRSRVCVPCGREWWYWQTECGACGAPTTDPTIQEVSA